ncbi:venom allergen 3-like [Chrysoperla carnea]|uniref:venom allergen 3-like n=1 Tax=Chrysoperla carnea TaxID=189513 RepID=UPI001D07D9C0|nr:venom allergen 3-like [Chrysoperla carnea]
MKFFVVTCTLVTLWFAVANSDYACDACHNISCLKNSQCSPGPKCNNYRNIPLSGNQKNQLLNKHNELRNRVAKGNQNGQPSASNMYELVWDDELANIAQCYANKCVFEHFRCELPKSRGGFGQNIYGSFSSNYPNKLNYDAAVQSWYNEVSVFPSNNVDKYKFNGSYGHYSQVVWAESKRIGCGAVLFKEGDWWKHQIYCNYGPPGNYIGSSVYHRGSPATSCSKGRSNKYDGLCKN